MKDNIFLILTLLVAGWLVFIPPNKSVSQSIPKEYNTPRQTQKDTSLRSKEREFEQATKELKQTVKEARQEVHSAEKNTNELTRLLRRKPKVVTRSDKDTVVLVMPSDTLIGLKREDTILVQRPIRKPGFFQRIFKRKR